MKAFSRDDKVDMHICYFEKWLERERHWVYAHQPGIGQNQVPGPPFSRMDDCSAPKLPAKTWTFEEALNLKFE